MDTLYRYIVKIDRTGEDVIDFGNGTKLFLDTSYNPMHHVVQFGIIENVPVKEKSRVTNLQVGDKVYFHHFVASEDNHFVDDLYYCDGFSIYLRERDGVVESCGDYIFLDYIEESEENYKTKSGIFIKAVAERIDRTGIVRYGNGAGFSVGDKVFYLKNHDYEMDIMGQKMYRMRVWSIMAKIVDEGIIPLQDYCVVDKVEKKEYSASGLELVNLDITMVSEKMKFEESKVLMVSGLVNEVKEGMFVMHSKAKVAEVVNGEQKVRMVKEEDIYVELVR